MDCDMETESSSGPGVTQQTPSGPPGSGDPSNMTASHPDVTLHQGVSQNRVPVGGRKRTRDGDDQPEHKRIRTAGGYLYKMNDSVVSSMLMQCLELFLIMPAPEEKTYL